MTLMGASCSRRTRSELSTNMPRSSSSFLSSIWKVSVRTAPSNGT